MFRITLRLDSRMAEDQAESWIAELLVEAQAHLLDGESLELETIEPA